MDETEILIESKSRNKGLSGNESSRKIINENIDELAGKKYLSSHRSIGYFQITMYNHVFFILSKTKVAALWTV